MTPWMTEHLNDTVPNTFRRPALAAELVLRAMDVALATALLVVLALPLAMAWLIGRPERRCMQGRHGVPFMQWRIEVPSSWWGRRWQAFGATGWPCLFNLLRGELAFVGPRARAEGEPVAPWTLKVRPGLIHPWYVRQRTAVDFGNEQQADVQYLALRGLRYDSGLLLRGAVVSLLSPPSLQTPECVQIGDVVFDNVDMDEALSRLRVMLAGDKPKQVSFVNPACVNIAARHRAYRRVLARAHLVLPDGIGIKIGSAMLGRPLKQNVNGTDLFPRLCTVLQQDRRRVFLLGGRPGVAEAVASQIARHWPGVSVVGVRDGYFNAAEEGEVVARVRSSGADLLLVARGVPAQDLFIDRHLPLLGVKVAMGVGGLFDFVSGTTARAPAWMRECGLEWVYRLRQEPSRMWRRYLLGNLSFLARVALQATGLRRPTAQDAPDRFDEDAPGQGLRCVLFATAHAPADMPLPTDYPAALMPLGFQSLIEHTFDHLATAGIQEVDLVVSDRPEAFRAILVDGSRWGIRIRWHLIKDSKRPYAFLRARAFQSAQRVLIGHAHVLLGVQSLESLRDKDGLSMQTCDEEGPRWLGWASTAPSRLIALGPDLDETALGLALQARALPPHVLGASEVTRVRSAAQLLSASFGAKGECPQAEAPAAWLRQPWGVMSPLARIHPHAVLVSPVVVGPGCIVEAGARIGPEVVLSRDVVVSSGTSLEHSLVLDNSFIGAELELSGTVVKGERIRHVRLGIEAAPAAADALLAELAPTAHGPTSLLARGLALMALVPAAPALATHLALRALSGHAPDWTLRSVVTGRDARTRKLITTRLRCAREEDVAQPSGWALLAGLLDVAAGRRHWIGMRPRSSSQWYALQPEWQTILASDRAGLLHAPAWREDVPLRHEACAAADVYLAVQSGWRRLHIVAKGWGRP